LTEAEKTRLADLAAAEALRERLKNSDAELTAMTLALEEERKRAEETLTLLAAAQEAAKTAETDKDRRAALLAEAEKVLSEKDQEILKAARDMALLNQQMTALRSQLGSLQALLDAAAAKDEAAKVQIEALGSQLNSALAQVASEQKRRADLEEAERKRLEAENQDLSRYRSEFFGQISQVLAGQPGVRVVGDRFVFDSEVLFNPGSADLAPEGQAQIARVVETLRPVVDRIPPEINWIIRVDGHTDNVPLSGAGEFADNWQLSQARALSVVRFMQQSLGFPPEKLAAAGFGEYQPVALGDSPEARAQNRRIELKLTER
jgi:chemotaxis protein MotB